MGILMIIIILDRFNRFIGSKALSRLDFPKMRFCGPYEFAMRIVKHMTAFFIGIDWNRVFTDIRHGLPIWGLYPFRQTTIRKLILADKNVDDALSSVLVSLRSIHWTSRYSSDSQRRAVTFGK